MSRCYNMAVTITGAVRDRIDTIKQAAEDEWAFDAWFLDDDGVLTASADERLCGGETEEEFAQRLAKAIWEANGDYCRVGVDATCLEDLPYETYCLEEDDYQRLVSPAAASQ